MSSSHCINSNVQPKQTDKFIIINPPLNFCILCCTILLYCPIWGRQSWQLPFPSLSVHKMSKYHEWKKKLTKFRIRKRSRFISAVFARSPPPPPQFRSFILQPPLFRFLWTFFNKSLLSCFSVHNFIFCLIRNRMFSLVELDQWWEGGGES